MTRLRQWDPWSELSAFERQVSELFNRNGTARTAMWAPPLEAFHRDGDLLVRLELPGVRPDDVEVTVAEGVLTVRGERRIDHELEDASFVRRERSYGAFERQVLLAEGTDAEAIEARFDLGVLELRIPTPKAKQPAKVTIKVGEPAAASQVAIDATSTDAGDTQGQRASNAA